MTTQLTTEIVGKGEPAALTPKGEQTRKHILETALGLFADKGYQATTMREIAAAAGCSLGLTYRYFSRKEEMVVALYARTAQELEEQVASLPHGTIAERYAAALEGDLVRLAPFREAMGTLFGVALVPDSELAVLGENLQELRAQVWGIFRKVIMEASDAPKPKQADDLATAFYAGYLAFLLFWLQDRTPNQQTTQELLSFGKDLLAKFRPALRLPLAGKQLARLVKIIGPMFGPMGKV
jgi:AcrR family transcriptional regulator